MFFETINTAETETNSFDHNTYDCLYVIVKTKNVQIQGFYSKKLHSSSITM